MGDKKAEKILEQVEFPQSYEEVVRQAYEDYFEGTEEGQTYCIQYGKGWEELYEENLALIEIGGELATENLQLDLRSSPASV